MPARVGRIVLISLAALLLFPALPAYAQTSASPAANKVRTIGMETPAIGRLPLPGPEDMTPAQREEYEKNPQARLNLSRLLDLAPTMAPLLRELNKAMATSITVPPLEREIVALAVLHLERGEWELAQHREVAKMMRIPDAKVAAIAEERYGDPIFTDREKALLNFTRQVVKTVRVDDPTFAAVAAFYDPRQIVETVFVITNYMMILRISEVDELPVDSLEGAGFWKHQARGN